LIALLGVACASKKPVEEARDLSPESVYREGRALLERRKTDQAIEKMQSIDFRYAADERARLEPLVRLGIADATFYRGSTIDLIDARSLYLEFVTLFGDHPLAPYAQFQAGVCSLKQTSHPSKDQSQTLAAFQDLREVERRYPGSRYALAAGDMIRRAEASLAEHDYIVGRFYLKRKHYEAAADRFRGLLKAYPDFREAEKVYYFLGRALLSNENDVEARVYLDKLVSDYPDSPYTPKARKALATATRNLEFGLDD